MIMRVPCCNCMPSGTVTRNTLRLAFRLEQLHDRDRHAVFEPAVLGDHANLLVVRVLALAADLHPRRIHQLRLLPAALRLCCCGRLRRRCGGRRCAGFGAAGLAAGFGVRLRQRGRRSRRQPAPATAAVSARRSGRAVAIRKFIHRPLFPPVGGPRHVGRSPLARLSPRQIRRERDPFAA